MLIELKATKSALDSVFNTNICLEFLPAFRNRRGSAVKQI